MSQPTDAQDEDKKEREQVAGKEEEEPQTVDITALDVYTTLKLFLNILASQSFIKMGLLVNPRTNKAEKDMKQARTAIDTFEFILKQIEGNLNEEEKRHLNNVLSDLKMNFVSHQ